MQYHVEPAICVGREGPAEPGDHAFTRVNTWGTLWGPGQQSQWLLPLNISNNPQPSFLVESQAADSSTNPRALARVRADPQHLAHMWLPATSSGFWGAQLHELSEGWSRG